MLYRVKRAFSTASFVWYHRARVFSCKSATNRLTNAATPGSGSFGVALTVDAGLADDAELLGLLGLLARVCSGGGAMMPVVLRMYSISARVSKTRLDPVTCNRMTLLLSSCEVREVGRIISFEANSFEGEDVLGSKLEAYLVGASTFRALHP